jgi:hypothetical protein
VGAFYIFWALNHEVWNWRKKWKSALQTYTSIYEGRLFVCFVCTYEIHRTGMLQIAFLVSLESSHRGAAHRLGFMAFGFAV